MQVNMAGLKFTEEELVSGWINRSIRDIKFKLSRTLAELETCDQGHTYKCFHNMEDIHAEIKALHFSAHLFYEKAEVKNQLLSIL